MRERTKGPRAVAVSLFAGRDLPHDRECRRSSEPLVERWAVRRERLLAGRGSLESADPVRGYLLGWDLQDDRRWRDLGSEEHRADVSGRDGRGARSPPDRAVHGLRVRWRDVQIHGRGRELVGDLAGPFGRLRRERDRHRPVRPLAPVRVAIGRRAVPVDGRRHELVGDRRPGSRRGVRGGVPVRRCDAVRLRAGNGPVAIHRRGRQLGVLRQRSRYGRARGDGVPAVGPSGGVRRAVRAGCVQVDGRRRDLDDRRRRPPDPGGRGARDRPRDADHGIRGHERIGHLSVDRRGG